MKITSKKALITLAVISSIGYQGCDFPGLLDLITASPSPGVNWDGTDITSDIETDQVQLIEGDMAGEDEFYFNMNRSLGKTSGALFQAILSVNSLLYTDNSITSLEEFNQRKLDADQALSTLEKYARETETIITNSENSLLIQKSLSTKSTLDPDDVLATVASGPSNKQIKTLMQKYQVNARTAKDILDNAMAGLSSKYKKDADFYDTAMRTAQLVKATADLTLTVAGTAITAGGVGGVLSLAGAGVFLIKGADGAIKVSKAGLELAVGKDLNLPAGKVSTILLNGLSDVSDIISITKLRGPWPAGKWADLDLKEKASYISKVYTIAKKSNEAIQNKEIKIGPLKVEVKTITDSITNLISPAIPFTLSGTYKVDGVKKVVGKLPEEVTNIINNLPDSDKLESVKQSSTPDNVSPTANPVATSTPAPVQGGTITTGFKEGAWCSIPVTISGVKLISDQWTTGWRYNGETWSVNGLSPVIGISGAITCGGPAWSYTDYTYSIAINANGKNKKSLFADSGTISLNGGSKSFQASFDSAKDKDWFGTAGSISVSVSVSGGNPEGSTAYTSGSISISGN